MPNFSRGRAQSAFDSGEQIKWLQAQFVPLLKALTSKGAYRKVIVVAGNHDWCHENPTTAPQAKAILESVPGVSYIQDEALEFEGVKFYGSPWQPFFYDWAFQFPEYDPISGNPTAVKIWAKVPNDTQVLITHGPPKRILDDAPSGPAVGCPILRDRVLQVKPKLHIFGHIHRCYGTKVSHDIRFANVALCDEEYNATNPIQVFEV